MIAFLLSPLGRIVGIGALVALAVGTAGLYVAGLKADTRRALAERDRARAAALSQHLSYAMCLGNRLILQSAIERQNAAVADLERRGRAASQEAAEALRRAQERHRNDAAVIARLRRPLTGATACERSDEAAERAREALR